jgi:hypothetical protein
MQMLYLELSRMEDRGITLWMEGYPSNPQDVASQMRVNEENSYMRDYVFNEGVLTEVHFDKINNTNTM